MYTSPRKIKANVFFMGFHLVLRSIFGIYAPTARGAKWLSFEIAKSGAIPGKDQLTISCALIRGLAFLN